MSVAPQEQTFKQPQQQIQPQQTQQQPQEVPELVQQATYDIMNGTDPKQVEKLYPELKDQIDVFYSLSETLKVRPINQVPSLFPELFTQEQVQSASSIQAQQQAQQPTQVQKEQP